jgi:hypothetical protein
MIPVVRFLIGFRRPLMVLKSAFATALCTGLLVLGAPAMADGYRPGEFLNMDLSKAVLSPKRLGPETEFAPVSIEAKSDSAQAAKVTEPKVTVRKTHVARISTTPARARLAHRRSNPLDAQAMDTRVQTWPCKSGGICNWQR